MEIRIVLRAIQNLDFGTPMSRAKKTKENLRKTKENLRKIKENLWKIKENLRKTSLAMSQQEDPAVKELRVGGYTLPSTMEVCERSSLRVAVYLGSLTCPGP